MWYMQPCWPDLRATRFWHDFIVLSGFGPGSRAIAIKTAKQADTNWDLNG